ncbi:MAG: hypothetical protein Q9220_000119 [cf. Caloplaca sp. 1 TL-2023]
MVLFTLQDLKKMGKAPSTIKVQGLEENVRTLQSTSSSQPAKVQNASKKIKRDDGSAEAMYQEPSGGSSEEYTSVSSSDRSSGSEQEHDSDSGDDTAERALGKPQMAEADRELEDDEHEEEQEDGSVLIVKGGVPPEEVESNVRKELPKLRSKQQKRARATLLKAYLNGRHEKHTKEEDLKGVLPKKPDEGARYWLVEGGGHYMGDSEGEEYKTKSGKTVLKRKGPTQRDDKGNIGFPVARKKQKR